MSLEWTRHKDLTFCNFENLLKNPEKFNTLEENDFLKCMAHVKGNVRGLPLTDDQKITSLKARRDFIDNRQAEVEKVKTEILETKPVVEETKYETPVVKVEENVEKEAAELPIIEPLF